MKHIRIIPRLDIKGPNLVKGIHLEGLRVLGTPEYFARHYYEKGADELFFQDTVASLYQRNNLTDIVTRTAKEIFIPLTVGGGLRSLDDINKVLRAGADKVAINTAAIGNPNFINEASRTFGSSTIMVAVEAIRQPDNTYSAYTDNGREHTGVDVLHWVREAEERGAGEIIITSIDKEGTGSGMDLELIRLISKEISIPLIAHGGAASASDLIKAINDGEADAVAAASMFHYAVLGCNEEIMENYKNEGNIEFLKRGNSYSIFGEANLLEIKKIISEHNIPIRLQA